MGNPASVTRKKTERRRKKFELRLGPGAYLSKEERAKLQAELAKIAATEKQQKAERKKQKEKKPEGKPEKK